MQDSRIIIDVELDENKMPSMINWQAPGTTVEEAQKAKAVILSFWDGAEKTALRMDLWTKDMMMDEMADFFYQTIMTMADTFERSTREKEQAEDMKTFAKSFYNKFREGQLKK